MPLNIGELLTPVGLAFLIMDDGYLGSNGELGLCTHSFSLEEIEMLIKVLQDNFNLYSRKSFVRPGQWTIIIPKRLVNKVCDLTIPHMHKSMWYKLGYDSK